MATQIETDVKNAETKKVVDILDDLRQQLDAGFLEQTVEIFGVLWKMQLLNDEESTFAARFVSETGIMGIIAAQRAPILAVGIRAIGKNITAPDGSPAQEFFSVENYFLNHWKQSDVATHDKVLKVIGGLTPEQRKFFFAERFHDWLTKRPPSLVAALWSEWSKLEMRARTAEEAMGKSSSEVGT